MTTTDRRPNRPPEPTDADRTRRSRATDAAPCTDAAAPSRARPDRAASRPRSGRADGPASPVEPDAAHQPPGRGLLARAGSHRPDPRHLADRVPPTPESWFEPRAAARPCPAAPRRRRRRSAPVLAPRSSPRSSLGRHVPRPARQRRPRPAGPTAPTAPAGQTATATQPGHRSTSRRRSSTSRRRSARPSSGSPVTGDANTQRPASRSRARASGPGVIYDPNGWILTNRHVVAGSDKLDGRAARTAASSRARSTASTP